MTEYTEMKILDRFGEKGKYHPDLFRKFMDWYKLALEPGISHHNYPDKVSTDRYTSFNRKALIIPALEKYQWLKEIF